MTRSPRITIDTTDGVTSITMDDGKVNVMSSAMLGDLHTAFREAEADEDTKVILLTSTAKVFSAGFDMAAFAAGADASLEMLVLGAELAERILTCSKPVVTACSGHAYPMGAFLMMCADVRLGADSDYRIGMNEVAIGLTLPAFAIEIARQRLTPAYFNRCLMTGEMLGPSEAAIAGFIDRVVPADTLDAQARYTALSLTQIDLKAHAGSKRKARDTAVKALRRAIESELTPDNLAAALGAA